MVRPPHSVTAGSSAKARGTELFATKGCAHCHGPAGVGGGKGPDLQLVRTRLHRGQIVAQIHDGGKSMPDFGDQLTPGQIDDLATYLLAKRKLIPVPPPPHPTARSALTHQRPRLSPPQTRRHSDPERSRRGRTPAFVPPLHPRFTPVRPALFMRPSAPEPQRPSCSQHHPNANH
jgi:cytochrome c553